MYQQLLNNGRFSGTFTNTFRSEDNAGKVLTLDTITQVLIVLLVNFDDADSRVFLI